VRLRGCIPVDISMDLSSRTPRPTPIRVLVVDEDVDSSEMYAMALGFAGFNAEVAADALSAFERALEYKPDVIVTAFILKGEATGAALCEWIHGDSRTAAIKVLVVTGSTRKPDAEALAGAGCSDIRMKPYLPSALIDDIEALMSDRPPAHA
jgi:two-component system OmpR family response regulator